MTSPHGSEDPADTNAVEIATDVIGHHTYDDRTRTCRCGDWTGERTAHTRHVARRLAAVGVLTTSDPT